MKLMPWIAENRTKIDAKLKQLGLSKSTLDDESRKQLILAIEPLYQEFRSQASWEEAN